MEWSWPKPVIMLYKMLLDSPQREPFAVVKAGELRFSKGSSGKFEGCIDTFFPLMGSVTDIATEGGMKHSYILCWFDDREDDTDKAWRQLKGVTFATFCRETSARGKIVYNATFHAEDGKLN